MGAHLLRDAGDPAHRERRRPGPPGVDRLPADHRVRHLPRHHGGVRHPPLGTRRLGHPRGRADRPGLRRPDHRLRRRPGERPGVLGLYRFGLIPLFLFSGTFFPLSQLPRWLQFVAYATPSTTASRCAAASSSAISGGSPARSTPPTSSRSSGSATRSPCGATGKDSSYERDRHHADPHHTDRRARLAPRAPSRRTERARLPPELAHLRLGVLRAFLLPALDRRGSEQARRRPPRREHRRRLHGVRRTRTARRPRR